MSALLPVEVSFLSTAQSSLVLAAKTTPTTGVKAVTGVGAYLRRKQDGEDDSEKDSKEDIEQEA